MKITNNLSSNFIWHFHYFNQIYCDVNDLLVYRCCISITFIASFFIPVDIHRPKLGLMLEGRNDFINAVYIAVRNNRDDKIFYIS